METDKIVLDLNRRFAVPLPEFYERRIIFWHDEEKEYADKLDEIIQFGAYQLKDWASVKIRGLIEKARV